jgi:hypothetical protein
MSNSDIEHQTDLILKVSIARIPVSIQGAFSDGKIEEFSGTVAIRKSLNAFLADLGADFGDASTILKQLTGGQISDIVLDSLAIGYRILEPKFAQVAVTLTAGASRCRFVILKRIGKDGFVAGLDLGLDEALFKNNPLSGLVGELSLGDLGIYYASDEFRNVKYDPGRGTRDVDALTPKIPEIKGRDFTKGLNWSAQIFVGGINLLDWSGIKDPKETDPDGGAAQRIGDAVPKAGETQLPKGSTTWINLNKSMGPLAVRRIGLSYEAPRVAVKFDAGLQLSVLTLSLMGLGISYPLNRFTTDPAKIWENLQFQLDGLAIGFKGGPIEISGALLKASNLGEGVSLQYDGSLMVKAEVFTLSAMGSYAVIQKKPSLFVFAVLAKELGGPAFFFVTGLAFGFGFNRLLKLPPIEDVQNFPLIKGAMDPGYFGGRSDPRAAMVKMQAYIVPSIGDYWLAAGVKFNSYGMINSFALITVSFGVNFQFALLGLSKITVPIQIPGAPAVDPVACAELALKVTFTLTTGVLAVEARLTDNSFIFARSCRLTGGFAFYCWFGPQHEGDFVVTLGGYHPKFVPPPHYPLVPRLGMNWSISSHLSITGEIYFALTPSCLMAGGKLNAVFQVGNLRAWFYAYADFLISWKPFYYDIAIGVSIGVSYRITFLGINKTLSIELGASVHLWGPPFGGIAHVSWFIISFDISFGKRKIRVPPPISWDEFHKSFLPQQQNYKELASSPDPVVGVIRITAGLIQEQEKKKGNGEKATLKVVNAHEFSFTTESLIPSTAVRLNGNSVGSAQTGQTSVLGIRPMGKSSLRSVHVVTVEKKRASAAGWDAYLDPSLVRKSVPYALWSNDLSRPDQPSAEKIDNVPSGMRVSLRNRDPSHGLDSIALEKFAYEDIDKFIGWQEFEIPSTIPAPGERTLVNTIWDNPAVDEKRNAILQALGSVGLRLQKIEVPELAANAGEIFQSKPDMAVLGEAFKKAQD